MSTDLATLRALVRQRVGVPTSDDFFTDTVLTATINQACATLDAEARWPWMETTAPQTLAGGASSFAAPADWRATRALFNGARELELIAPSDLMALGIQSGAPAVWSVRGSQVLVAPAPPSDVSLTHYYYLQTARLVLDADVVVTPDQFIDAIVCKAAELLSAREDDSSARQLHATDYGRWIDRMRRDVRRSTGPLKVRVRPGGWV